jgi:glycosyltransferase EpsD
MNKKVLFTASIAKHFLRFHLPYLKWFKEEGYEVHIACDGAEDVPFTDKKWIVPFVRSPFSTGHIKAYKVLKEIIDREQYHLVHCHTPMASIVTRLAAKETRKKGTKVLYTAHGFHFYNGAPLINWLTYYPVEIFTSAYADAIITINGEDYERIRKKGNKKTNYFLIPGIGVEKSKFYPVDQVKRRNIRIDKNFTENDFIAIYAAEFIPRKNHQFLIETIAKHKGDFPDLKVLFCGRGVLKDKLEMLVKEKNLETVFLFMGFRNDIDELFKMADLGVSASKQEGLGLNLIEEMMCNLPILATEDRGHKEIVISGENGFLFEQENKEEFIAYLKELYTNKEMRKIFGKNAQELSQKFEITNSLNAMSKIYKNFL